MQAFDAPHSCGRAVTPSSHHTNDMAAQALHYRLIIEINGTERHLYLYGL